MFKLLRTDSSNNDFIKLVQNLDSDLAVRDGEDHLFYSQFNKIDTIKYTVVAYDNNVPVGCGALKEFAAGIFEIKRMYTQPDFRGNGIASKILMELEIWAKEMSFSKCILETGKKQPEAIKLYQKNGYQLITNYGQYTDVKNSLCFEKLIK